MGRHLSVASKFSGSQSGAKSYVEATRAFQGGSARNGGSKEASFQFAMKDEDVVRFKRAFVGFVVIPGSSSNIQTHFKMERYFSIKVTSL